MAVATDTRAVGAAAALAIGGTIGLDALVGGPITGPFAATGRVSLRRKRLMARVLFVCLHNAGRSQMSEALFNKAAAGRHEGRSAGTTPAESVHPEVVEVMREVDINLAERRPRRLDREMAQWADVVVTMGCGDECPYIPGKRYIDWDLEDPRGQAPNQVRATREEIRRRVSDLARELDASSS